MCAWIIKSDVQETLYTYKNQFIVSQSLKIAWKLSRENMFWKLLLITVIFDAEARTLIEKKCRISLNYGDEDRQWHQPLMLSHTKKSYDFLYPDKKTGELTLNFAEKLILSCPGARNSIQGIESLKKTTEIEVVCLKDTIFITKGVKFDIRSVSCKKLPVHVARRNKYACFEDSSLIEIGFQLEKYFLPTLEVCRNERTLSTHYTKFLLSKHIGARQMGFPRASKWITGDFHGDYDMDSLYKTMTQVETLAKLLDSQELANNYINPSTTRFLAKGHLTAKADFVYGSVQMSTFWYLNAAPQWQTFNAGNWNSLEDNVRTFADKKSLDLIVYTGTHGQMSLFDNNNNKIPVYLYVNGDDYGIPVPKYFWKVVYDPERRRGTAFVGVNDPYAKKITDDMFLCDDISDRIKWLTWQSNSISKGVSYACSIDDLREVIRSVPKLEVEGLLY